MFSQDAFLYMFIIMWVVSFAACILHFKFVKSAAMYLVPFLILSAMHPLYHGALSPEVSSAVSAMGSLIFAIFLIIELPARKLKAANGLGGVHFQSDKYEEMAEHASDLLLILNYDGVITYANQAVKQWTGYTSADLKHLGLSCICEGSQRVALQEGLELAKSNKNHPYVVPEIEIHPKNKQLSFFEAKITYLPDVTGIEGWVVSLRNIQRRKDVQASFDVHLKINALLLRCSQKFLMANNQNMNVKIDAVLRELIQESGIEGCALWQNVDSNIREKFIYPSNACVPSGWRSFAGLKKQRWLFAELERFEDVVIADVDELPEEAESERKALTSAGAESALFFPLKGSAKDGTSIVDGVFAVMVKDSRVWSEDFVAQLSLFAKMVSVAMHRHFSDDQLRILSQAVEQSPSSVLIMDPEGKVEFINRRFEDVTGYRAREVIGKDSAMFNAEHNDPELIKQVWSTIIEGHDWQGELLDRKKNGEIFWEHIHVTPIRDNNGAIKHFLSVREDISLRKQYEEALDLKSHYDALTGLPNRALAMDRLEEAVGRADEGELVSAMVVGLDTFKKVNDTYGHNVGDALLIEASGRIKDIAEKYEHTIARLGGDEFLVILSDCTKEQVEIAVSHINQAFKEPFKLEGQPQNITVTATIGVSVSPDDGKDAQTLLQSADIAMHRAKETGKDSFKFYTEEIHVDAVARVRMEALLRRAIEQDELNLFYQPIISASDEHIAGAEALIRWQSDELGFVSPMDFIPLAEDIGLIVPIGEWVLETACKQINKWDGVQGAPDYVTVNVSARQFEHGGFVDTVKNVLKRTKTKPTCLHLEVTESLLIDEGMHVENDLKCISDMGVRISLDDFGTGYSSLSYLKRYHFDTLKIDRSFVNDVPEDDDDKALVEAIMVMAHSLKMDVVAEGVETVDQKDYLRTLECDRFQGFFFSKPLPADEFDVFVSKWQK